MTTAAAPVSLPEGFGASPRHETTRAVWSTASGESPSTVDRTLVERVCAMKHSIDPATRTPVFLPGTDRPNAVTSVHVTTARAWASYETIRGALCDSATKGPAGDLCSCTFREVTSRFIHIRKSQDGRSESIDVDLARGTATLRIGKTTSMSLQAPPSAGVFGTVVGHDTVAGMPCTVYRQDLGTGRIERCLADPVDTLPPSLHMQELSMTRYLLGTGAPVRRDWHRTDRVDADAEIDTGVFDVPAGITVHAVGQPASPP